MYKMLFYHFCHNPVNISKGLYQVVAGIFVWIILTKRYCISDFCRIVRNPLYLSLSLPWLLLFIQ